MIEVKLSDEPAKAGAAPGELPLWWRRFERCPHLRLLGLMTMPPWSDDAEQSRPYFARLRELAEQNGLRASCPWGCRTIWKWPSKRARPWCAWGRPCLARGKSRDRRIFLASAPGAHRRRRLFRRISARARAARLREGERARAPTFRLYHLGNNQLASRNLRPGARAAWRGGAARRRAAAFLSGWSETNGNTSPSSSTTTVSGAKIWHASCGAVGRVRPPTLNTSAIQ